MGRFGSLGTRFGPGPTTEGSKGEVASRPGRDGPQLEVEG